MVFQSSHCCHFWRRHKEKGSNSDLSKTNSLLYHFESANYKSKNNVKTQLIENKNKVNELLNNVNFCITLNNIHLTSHKYGLLQLKLELANGIKKCLHCS